MTTETITTEHMTDDLLWLFDKVAVNNDHRSDNYIVNNINNKDKILCATVTYHNDVPALGSIAWTRPGYNGAVRIVTKYCANPDLRFTPFDKGLDRTLRVEVVDHVIQQTEFCELLGYSKFFISMESKGKRVRTYAEVIDKYDEVYDWKCSAEPVLVCPDANNPACWQYLIYNEDITFSYANTRS